MAQEAKSLNNQWFCTTFVQESAFRSRHPQKCLRKDLQKRNVMNDDVDDDDVDDDDLSLIHI